MPSGVMDGDTVHFLSENSYLDNKKSPLSQFCDVGSRVLEFALCFNVKTTTTERWTGIIWATLPVKLQADRAQWQKNDLNELS